MSTGAAPLLDVSHLSVSFRTRDGIVQAVSDLSFTLQRGETLGVVGESGSGKSVTSLAIMGLLNRAHADVTGEILFEGKDLLTLSKEQLRKIRGRDVSMIFQDPFACLHPMYRVGQQIAEAVHAHERASKRVAWDRAVELLDAVGIPNARVRARDYPHQYSGGMRQRAMIAMALVHNPDVLIADEPTTALDVTVQAQILELIDKVKKEFDIGVILITHDLGVVAETATHVMVMYAGRAMEYGPASEIFNHAQHPYTWGLLESMPTVDKRLDVLIPIEGSPPSLLRPPPGCPFHPRCKYRFSPCDQERPPFVSIPGGHPDACHLPAERKREIWENRIAAELGCADVTVTELSAEHRAGHGPLVEVEHLTKRFPVKQGVFSRGGTWVHAVEDISFTVNKGETLGLVGESGCGKSTTARLVVRLLEPTGGTVRFDGQDISRLSQRQLRPVRQQMQIIFQDPYSSLNPRKSVGQIVAEPFAIHRTDKDVKSRVRDLLARVGLSPEHYNRYPHEFSGGQRQRIGIARALALQPRLIVCDEPVSALDVSVQAQILNLLKSLQDEFDLTYIFISHDLSVIRQVSDRIAVMYVGRVVEIGESERLYEHPRHPYTAALLSAVPKPETNGSGFNTRQRIVLKGDVPSPVAPPPACVFHPRCPRFQPGHCDVETPQLRAFDGDHEAACHYPVERWPMTEQELSRRPAISAPGEVA